MIQTQYTSKDIKRYICQELKTYKAKFADITKEEREGLSEWVSEGHDPHGNPWRLFGENGHELDYINACRIFDDYLSSVANRSLDDDTKSIYIKF